MGGILFEAAKVRIMSQIIFQSICQHFTYMHNGNQPEKIILSLDLSVENLVQVSPLMAVFTQHP